ncbi:hypothetical protein LCGC14_1423930 [marine sediment metagenome]|uniref:Uncharacterized protein n=1 Tax=marine sediment metagenome TaxID=412755 RepID=A0A0F9MS85_9ZZZZ
MDVQAENEAERLHNTRQVRIKAAEAVAKERDDWQARAKVAEKLCQDLLPAAKWGLAMSARGANPWFVQEAGNSGVTISVEQREAAKTAVAKPTEDGE